MMQDWSIFRTTQLTLTFSFEKAFSRRFNSSLFPDFLKLPLKRESPIYKYAFKPKVNVKVTDSLVIIYLSPLLIDTDFFSAGSQLHRSLPPKFHVFPIQRSHGTPAAHLNREINRSHGFCERARQALRSFGMQTLFDLIHPNDANLCC